MVSSEEVAVWTSSQAVMDVAESVEIRDSWRRVSMGSSSCETVDNLAISWLRMWIVGWCWTETELTSSWRCILAGVGGPEGWRESVSEALFLTPGMCDILNL